MKNTLAIDTSTAYLSLALEAHNKVYAFTQRVENKHSENILPQIVGLLAEAGIEAGVLDFIVYNQGPGSFTGLRIGLSVALGLSFASGALLIPVPAFAIHALDAYERSGCTRVNVGLDARLGQLYFAGLTMPYLAYFIQPQLINPQDIVIEEDAAITGSGFIEYKDLLPPDLRDKPPTNQASLNASFLLKLAKSGKFLPIEASQADLLYLRNKVALNLEEQKNAHKAG
jgi:tRNA threonylcarbamoyladenosine biosynthesis protein TsaB